MWGFATQAGAGVAIAGLTATYYALAHRNYHGEREHRYGNEAGHGDGPSVKRGLDIDNSALTLSSSQMLLKKELEELSSMQGSSSGLNILYQPSHPLYRFQKSRFEITPIISRVNTTDSPAFSSDSEDEFVRVERSPRGDGDKFKGSEVVQEKEKSLITTPDLSMTPVVIDKEKFQQELEEMRNKREDKISQTMIVAEEEGMKEQNKDENEDEASMTDNCKILHDNLSLHRTTSPICFFKNPGFGNRFAYRMKNEPIFAEALHPPQEKEEEDGKKVKKMDSKGVQTPDPKEYRDSTQFIMSPVLSESNVSLCDKETPERYLHKRRKKSAKGEKDKNLSNAGEVRHDYSKQDPIEKINPLDAMTEYNDKLRRKMFQNRNREQMKRDFKTGPLIKLRADPEVCNLRITPKTTTTSRKKKGKPAAIPVKVPMPDLKQETPISEPNDNVFPVEEETVTNSPEDVNSPLKEEDTSGVVEEPLLVPSRCSDCKLRHRESIVTFSTSPSSLVTRIPDDSWIALPIRIYTNSISTMPWSLVSVCVFVVIIIGFLGMIMTKLANRIAIDRRLR